MQKGYDMVIASRYLGSAKSYDDDWVTRFGNLLFRTLINLLFKPKTSALMTDPFVMYRAHKKDLPSRLGIDKLEPLDKLFRTNSCWIPLLSIRALKNKIRWTEIPVDEPTRIGGIRKLHIFRYGALHLMQILREWTLKGQTNLLSSVEALRALAWLASLTKKPSFSKPRRRWEVFAALLILTEFTTM